MKINFHHLLLKSSLAAAVFVAYLLVSAPSAEAYRQIVFPVVGPARFTNDFYVPRPKGIHGATDVMANKGQPLIAAVDGTITYVAWPQPSFGYDVEITDDEGYTYIYLHINDDNPGTNDGLGGGMNAYAPDMKVGNRVVKGQQLGWVGDSGHSNGVPHLHFEIIAPDGSQVNPYESLKYAPTYSYPAWYPQLPHEALPYNVLFKGSINIAMGNFDADPEPETVTGAGAPGGPHIRFMDNNHIVFPNKGFYAYAPSFTGGVDVAAGDIDGDGVDEVITGPGYGGGPHIRVFKVDGTLVGEFYAYAPSFPGGVRVAAGDVDGDGNDEIITGAGVGGGPHVRVFEANGTAVGGFYAYAANFTGGIDVASSNLTGTARDEIVTSPGPGGGPQIRLFNSDGTSIRSFHAYDPSYTGGVRISAGDVDENTAFSEILTAPWTNGGSHLRLFDDEGVVVEEKMFLEPWWGGYYDVAAGKGDSKASAGVNRRGTVRHGIEIVD